MATLTQAQRESLEEGGLSQGCVDNHLDRVCPHCGACQRCSSGCGCDDEAEEVSREDIAALQVEAGEAGDDAQVQFCIAALAGDRGAWAKCEAAIASARAQQ